MLSSIQAVDLGEQKGIGWEAVGLHIDCRTVVFSARNVRDHSAGRCFSPSLTWSFVPFPSLCHSNFEPEVGAGAEAATLATTTIAATMIFKREPGKRSGTPSTRPRARSITWYVSG